jgi:hypothetical protein
MAGADPDVQLKVPTEEDSRDMMNKAIRASGESDNWIYSGHPKTVNKVLSARAGKGEARLGPASRSEPTSRDRSCTFAERAS